MTMGGSAALAACHALLDQASTNQASSLSSPRSDFLPSNKCFLFQASLGYTSYTIHRNSQLIQRLIGEPENTSDYYNPNLNAVVTAIQLWC